MDKQALRRDLTRAAGGSLFINKSQLKAALGCGNNENSLVNRVTKNLNYITQGRAKCFYIGDVVTELGKYVEGGRYE